MLEGALGEALLHLRVLLAELDAMAQIRAGLEQSLLSHTHLINALLLRRGSSPLPPVQDLQQLQADLVAAAQPQGRQLVPEVPRAMTPPPAGFRV